MVQLSKVKLRRLKSQVTAKLCGLINQLTKDKSKEAYQTDKVLKLGVKQMKPNWTNISSTKALGKMVKWKGSANCICHKVKSILVSLFKATPVVTVLVSGSMATSMKAASKMVINKVMALSCARRVDGLLVVTGSKVKWMARALVSGKIAPSIKGSGGIVLRKVMGHWAILMAHFIKVILVTIIQMGKARKILLMVQFIQGLS